LPVEIKGSSAVPFSYDACVPLTPSISKYFRLEGIQECGKILPLQLQQAIPHKMKNKTTGYPEK
jgi:hypothetical protein